MILIQNTCELMGPSQVAHLTTRPTDLSTGKVIWSAQRYDSSTTCLRLDRYLSATRPPGKYLPCIIFWPRARRENVGKLPVIPGGSKDHPPGEKRGGLVFPEGGNFQLF